MRTYKIIGFVLKRKNINEADRIITVFTKEEGKINVKAKGVRKITSKRSAHVEPLNKTVLTIYKNGNLPLVTEAESINSYEIIKKNLSLVGFTYHICELIDSLCPEGQPHPEIFSLLENILYELPRGKSVGSLIHSFELQLLAMLGYLPLHYDLAGAKASYFIENILERKLKSRQILPHLL